MQTLWIQSLALGTCLMPATALLMLFSSAQAADSPPTPSPPASVDQQHALEGDVPGSSRLLPAASSRVAAAEKAVKEGGEADSPPDGGVISWKGTDIHGRELQIPPGNVQHPESLRGVALIFLLHDCPVANSYAPELRRIHDQFAPQGISFYFVHVDPQLKAEKAREHAEDFQIPGHVLINPDHQLVAATGVTRVPEAAVISPGGELLYRGRIDDLYAGFGQRRAAPRQHDLRNALQAILDKKEVPAATGEVVGCPIPPLSLPRSRTQPSRP